MNMTYEEILKQIAAEENISEKEIESEMQKALDGAGLDCTSKEFIEIISFFIGKRRYIA